MIRFVIDASAAVEVLLRTPLGQKLENQLENAFLLAPELLDPEVLAVLRRAVLQGRIEEGRARLALQDLDDWQIDRISHRLLWRDAWEHRHNVSAYDAFYVALAGLSGAPLLTADGPLSRAPRLGIAIQNVRLA
jgi:predicted nucleic acid-binding protein